jgi:hypothetical protein
MPECKHATFNYQLRAKFRQYIDEKEISVPRMPITFAAQVQLDREITTEKWWQGAHFPDIVKFPDISLTVHDT